jgi:cytochrome P450
MNRYFSTASITKLEPLIQSLIQKFCTKILARAGDGEPFDITAAYSCFTTDVISTYCFGESFGFLDRDNFEPNLRQGVLSACKIIPFAKQLPAMFVLINGLPRLVISANILYMAG